MNPAYTTTAHARDRATARNIPPMIADLILEFGESRDAGRGARSYFLTKDSMRRIRRWAGREIAKSLERYRTRNTYVIEAQGLIITVAHAH